MFSLCVHNLSCFICMKLACERVTLFLVLWCENCNHFKIKVFNINTETWIKHTKSCCNLPFNLLHALYFHVSTWVLKENSHYICRDWFRHCFLFFIFILLGFLFLCFHTDIRDYSLGRNRQKGLSEFKSKDNILITKSLVLNFFFFPLLLALRLFC